MQDNDATSHDKYDDDVSDLMLRADNGDALTDEELATLASHGRCPGCGRTRHAEPGYDECRSTGFHWTTADEASDSHGNAGQEPPQGAPGMGSAAPERDYLTTPHDLRRRAQWVVWRLEGIPDRDKPTKVLYSPATHTRASTTDSLTWSTFEQAVAVFQSGDYDGVGFVLSSGDPYTFIDLDRAIDADKRATLLANKSNDSFAGLKPWARFVRDVAPYAYVALSQSGTGLHVIMRGKLPTCGRKPVVVDGETVGEIEMYDQKRFIALTGRTL